MAKLPQNQHSLLCYSSKLIASSLALGGVLLPQIVNASLVTGNDPSGYRTGVFALNLGAGQLTFNGTTYNSSPAYSYKTDVSASAGTEFIWGPAFSANALIDASDSYSAGTQNLVDRWQSGYMAYAPGGGGCDRWSCWSYPGYYYPVTTGSGTSGAWTNNQHGYLGFRFQDNGWHYGWAELTVSDQNYDIGSWAFESVSDVGIVTGSSVSLYVAPPVSQPSEIQAAQNVPEPGTLALLALGMVGLAAFRARKV